MSALSKTFSDSEVYIYWAREVYAAALKAPKAVF